MDTAEFKSCPVCGSNHIRSLKAWDNVTIDQFDNQIESEYIQCLQCKTQLLREKWNCFWINLAEANSKIIILDKEIGNLRNISVRYSKLFGIIEKFRKDTGIILFE